MKVTLTLVDLKALAQRSVNPEAMVAILLEWGDSADAEITRLTAKVAELELQVKVMQDGSQG